MFNCNLFALLLVLLCCTMFEVSPKKLPSFVKPCVRNGQDLNKCVIKVMNEIRNQLAKGIPAMGVPPLDPLKIPKLAVTTGNGTNFGYSVTFTDMIFKGARDFEVQSVVVDLDNVQLAMKMNIPKFITTGHYNNTGKLLLFTFDGDGVVRTNFTNTLIDGVWYGEEYTKDGNRHFRFPKSKVDVTVGHISAYFEDVFKANPELTANFNKFINENHDALYDEIKPVISDAITQLVTSVINRVYEFFPLDELYPPS